MVCSAFPSFHFHLSIFQWVERKKLVCDHAYLHARTSPTVRNASYQENRRHIVVIENTLQVFVFPSCSQQQGKGELPTEQPSCAMLRPPIAPFSIQGGGRCCWGDKSPTELCSRAARGVSLLPGLPARDPGLPEEAHGLRLCAAEHHHRLHGSYVCSFAFWPWEAGSSTGDVSQISPQKLG